MGSIITILYTITSFNKKIYKILFFILFEQVILFTFFQHFLFAEEIYSNKIKFEITTDNSQYDIGEPIILSGKITNLSIETITIEPILFINSIIYIKYDKDYVPLQYEFFVDEVINKEKLKLLCQNESYLFKRKVSNNYYGFPNRAGRYSLFVTYWNASESFENIKLWTGKLTSNIIQFDVVKE